MEIDKYNLDDLVSDKYFYKKINDNFYLNDYQINVLKSSGIDYNKYSSLKELLFELDEILYEEDNEQLDAISRELEEFYYYNFVNK